MIQKASSNDDAAQMRPAGSIAGSQVHASWSAGPLACQSGLRAGSELAAGSTSGVGDDGWTDGDGPPAPGLVVVAGAGLVGTPDADDDVPDDVVAAVEAMGADDPHPAASTVTATKVIPSRIGRRAVRPTVVIAFILEIGVIRRCRCDAPSGSPVGGSCRSPNRQEGAGVQADEHRSVGDGRRERDARRRDGPA